MNNNVCMYLRKSREDVELEKTGDFETLARHQKTLLLFAKKNKINIVEIKKEMKTGDSIAARPEMMNLLSEIKNGKYYGVLVVDIQRLCRGSLADQGVLIKTFKENNTKIITPKKTYDLSNEIDETYVEFETFVGRQEYKYIKKRFDEGRVAYAMGGNYASPVAPYGYDIVYENKNRFLKINEKEAEAIRIIFNEYSMGVGTNIISEILNEKGYKSRTGIKFSPSTILFIIKNPLYAGYITWKKRKEERPGDKKHKKCITYSRDKWIMAQGKHEPIISKKLYDECYEILKNKNYKSYKTKMVNPFAGIIICAVCQHKMVMRNDRNKIPRLKCIGNCGNISNKFDEVETIIIQELENYYKKYTENIYINNKNVMQNKSENIASVQSQINILEKQLHNLDEQKNKLFDDLECGKCSENDFVENIQIVKKSIKEISEYIVEMKDYIARYNYRMDVKTEKVIFRNLLDGFYATDDVAKKKSLLEKIVYKIEYKKDEENGITIKLFPKLN